MAKTKADNFAGASDSRYAINAATASTGRLDSVRPVSIPANRVTASVIADKIIDFCNEHGDSVTNLKLQKLLYYVQAWHLAFYGSALFPERIEAWANGPVQPEVYARFSPCGHRVIEQPLSEWIVSKRIRKHIQDTMEAYVHLSAFDLERLACSEEPWRKARSGLSPEEASSAAISIESMRQFYKSRLNEQAT